MSFEPATIARHPIRILVADDDPIHRRLMCTRLVRFNGQTVEAEDGLAAWTLLCSQTFDIAIVDLGMPNLDGVSLIQCMRGHPRTRHLPIIVVTSQNDRASIDRAFQVGASSFLMKPVAWSTFEHHVGFLMRLVESARAWRMASHQAAAAGRAKDNILGDLCEETVATAASIRKEVEFIKSTMGSVMPASGLVTRLDQIISHCVAMQSLADRAETALQELSDKVAVDGCKTLLANVVTRALEQLQPSADEAGVQVHVALPRGNIILSCDPDSILLALTQLLQTAIVHSLRGDTVRLAATIYDDGVLSLEVEDHGTGIDPELLARCLSPLHAYGDGNREGLQIGLGLWLAKAIAEAHDGTLELRSAPGEGTIAALVVPADRVVHVVAAA